MGSEFIQSGNLSGTLNTAGTLQATLNEESTLTGEITIPDKVVVEKFVILPKIGVVKLLASAWVGSDNLYHQVVEIEGATVTENSQVDLTPSAEQLQIFYNKDISFVTENEGGVVTVYVIGQKPTNDYIIQVTITEVAV